MKKILQILSLSCIASTCFANTLFSIVPNMNPVTVRSDGYAIVPYTVINTGGNTYGKITTPALGINGASVQSLDNTCTGTSLAVGAHCHFNVEITGSIAPSGIRPRVCAANGAACSIATAANALTVSVYQMGQTYAYLPMYAASENHGNLGTNANSVLPVSTTAPYTLGTPLTQYGDNISFSFNSNQIYSGVAISHDGQYVYVVDQGNNNLVIMKTGSPPIYQGYINFQGSNHSLNAVAVSPDGNTAYVIDEDEKHLFVVNVSNKQDPVLRRTVTLNYPPYGLTVSPDGSKVYLIDSSGQEFGGYISTVNTTDNYSIINQVIPHNGSSDGLVISPDGTTVYFPAVEYTDPQHFVVDQLDTTSGIISQLASLESFPYKIAISPDGLHLYVTDNALGKLAIINVLDPTQVTGVTIANHPEGAAVSPDGTKVFVTSNGISNLTVVNPTELNYVLSPDLGGKSNAFGNFVG